MPGMNDLLAVANAYREEHILGNGQFAANKAARRAYRMRHPGATEAEIDRNVPRLIAEAAEEFGPWLYGREDVDNDGE